MKYAKQNLNSKIKKYQVAEHNNNLVSVLLKQHPKKT